MERTTTQGAISEKSRAAALALAIVLGLFGGHRFYVGKIGTGLLMLLTVGGLSFWWLYDLIVIGAGGFRDAEGRRVLRWIESDPEDPTLRAGGDRKQDLILSELDTLRGDVAELQERLDFMERVLAQVKDRPPLSAGGR